MPRGRYTVLGDDGEAVGAESFRYGAGVSGWWWFSDVDTRDPEPHRVILDVAVDAYWNIARVRVDTGIHHLFLERKDDSLVGIRDDQPFKVPFPPETHLDVYSPVTNLITTKRLDASSEIDVVYVAPITLDLSLVRQRYELRGPDRVSTPVGEFDAVRWTFTALDIDWTADLWVADDTVVAYERLFKLAELEA